MSQKLRSQLKDLGAKLKSPPSSSKDALVKLLKQAASCLSELDQTPSPSMLESLRPCLNAIVKQEFLKHQDRDVKLLVATCICEITRITAPEAPYSDDVLRDIFHLIVGTFSGLGDVNGPSFGRRVIILETLAKYRSCVVMLDLDCDDLVNEMFSIFLAVARDDHPESVLTSMQTIMVLLIEESEDIQDNLLVILLSPLGRAKNDISLAGRKLAMSVIEQSAEKLESCIKQYLISSMTGDNTSLTSQLDYHDVIFDISRCAPQILSGVIPYLTGELLSDQLGTRMKAVKLLGDLFALPDCVISEPFKPIFSEFLKRLTDRAVEVRMSVVGQVKRCLLSNPLRPESPQIICALCERLFDYDENVRKEVVAALCDVACSTLKSIPVETLRLVAERLRDKSLLVKRYTMERIAEIYRLYCLKCSDVSISSSDFEWIPGKILRCFYDKDVRAETIEVVLCGSLFPKDFSTNDQVKHWVTVFSRLEKVEVKALEKMLEQKHRLQQEMQKYLSLRHMMHQDGDALEYQKKMLLSFRVMSRWFVDPAKAEDNFKILDQLKDANVWKILSNLLDSKTSFQQAWTYRDELLKILGEKHPLYDFLGTLSPKCSYLLFNKDCVKEIILEINTEKSSGSTQHIESCMNLLVILARFSPSLLSGTEEDLVTFIKEDDAIIKEGALHILALSGGIIREQLAVTSSSVELILERLCLEGNRKQAKYAVHALAAITKDDGLMSLSVLYKRLVDMLAEKTHLPAILQSLGCIAETAMPIFETRESEIVGFITSNILECSTKEEDNAKTSWEERSELCMLKIYSLKTLVKSYLPVKDAHPRRGIENFLGILRNILLTGEVSIHVKSSQVDKAHMKLASAKAILRLSKHWDQKIPIDVFHLTLRTPEIIYTQAKKQFLGKVVQYIKDRLLDMKYSCAFSFNIIGFVQPDFEEERHNLVEVIQVCNQAKARQLPMLCDSNPVMTYPEYVLPYLVHALAHHSSFPNVDDCTDVKAFELMYWQLHLFVSVLVYGDEEGKSEVCNSKEKERIATIISIFQSIKCSEDVCSGKKSKNSHVVCDLGLLIMKHLARKPEDMTGLTRLVPLPAILYRSLEKKDGDGGKEEQSWLVGDSVLAHLESLKLGLNGTVAEDVKDSENNDLDGNDVPLGQMLKKIKAQGTKAKKVGKKKIAPTDAENAENDVKLSGLVEGLHKIHVEGSNDVGLGNGHEYNVPGESDGQSEEEKAISRKRKRRKTGDATPIPKRKRSSSGHNVHRISHSWSYSKVSKKDSKDDSHDTEFSSSQSVDEDAETAETDLLASCFPRNENLSSKSKRKSSDPNSKSEHMLETGDIDVKPIRSSLGPIKKRKRRSIAVLAKCSSKEGEKHKLVGRRIKVWWPLDKQFYEGLVQSYDPEQNNHVVLYNDGDTEILQLDKERWELIADGHTPKKLLNLPNISPVKSVSAEQKKKNRTSSSLRPNKKAIKKSSSSKVRRKGTPKKSLKHRQSDSSDIKSDAESERISDSSNSRSPKKSKADGTSSGDSARKSVEAREKSLTDSEDEKEEKSDAEAKHANNVGASLKTLQESDKEDKSISDEKLFEETEKSISVDKKSEKMKLDSERGQQVDGIEKKLSDANGSEDDKSDSDGEGKDKKDTEKTPMDLDQKDKSDSDDEPLGVWKRRIVKGKAL